MTHIIALTFYFETCKALLTIIFTIEFYELQLPFVGGVFLSQQPAIQRVNINTNTEPIA